MIRSYGVHWHVERVNWGSKGVLGKLLGAASRSPISRPVDFRYQRGIYALYADYELVYIGQTGGENQRLFDRLKTHKSDHLSERWNRFSWFGIHRVLATGELSADAAGVGASVKVALNILEAVAIAIAEPRLNLQRGKWGNATPYFQWWEREVDQLEEK